MSYPNVSAKRPAELVGGIIDSHYALRLIRGFKDKFPGKVSTEAIGNTGRAKEIYEELYRNQVCECNRMIEAGQYEEAKKLFEQTMEGLMKEYLF